MPRLHYARFAFDRQQHVHCLDKRLGTVRIRSAAQLYVRDFYNFIFGGVVRDDVETLLASIEARAPRVLRVLDRINPPARFSLADRDRYSLSMYLAALHLRSPKMRNWILDDLTTRASHEVALRFAKAGPKYWRSARALLEGAVRITPEDQAALVVFRELHRVGRIIFGSNWALAVRPTAPYFVLGDAPGTGFVPPRGGWFLFVPISPERAVVVGRGHQDGTGFEIPAANPSNLNSLAYQASTQTIVARDRADLDALIP